MAQLTLAMLRARRDEIRAVAEKYGVTNVRIVGSIARGDANADSDVDLLMTIPPQSALKLVALWDELETLLGVSVHIIDDKTPKTRLLASVLEDAVVL